MTSLRRLRLALEIATAACIIGAGVAILSAPAAAHEWYSPFCCDNRDCAPVPDSAVTIVPGIGYRIILGPLDHPMVTKPLEAIIPFDEARISQDDRDHACIYPKDVARCLYVRPRGM